MFKNLLSKCKIIQNKEDVSYWIEILGEVSETTIIPHHQHRWLKSLFIKRCWQCTKLFGTCWCWLNPKRSECFIWYSPTQWNRDKEYVTIKTVWSLFGQVMKKHNMITTLLIMSTIICSRKNRMRNKNKLKN